MFCWGKQSIKVEYFHAGPTIAECQHRPPVEPFRASQGPVIPAAPTDSGQTSGPVGKAAKP